MSQSVEKLKSLLFDEEAEARRGLERSLEQRIAAVALEDAQGREELRKKVEQVFARAGTRESLTSSVSEVLDEALRQAEVVQHEDLSRAIAPLVVTTIKAELRNSQDEMVEALYPITGRLVKSYVASAMKDLTEQMNRRLEQNPVMLRLQSITTGRSVAELALADSQSFEVNAIYLIRRATGELVARWPATSTSSRDQSLSGVLAAINEFANEALSAEQESLRQIEIGNEAIYLRGSPLYLLAAQCTGRAPENIEQLLDEKFLQAIAIQNSLDQKYDVSGDRLAATATSIQTLGNDLSSKVIEEVASYKARRSGGNPLKYLAIAVLLPVLTYVGWNWYGQYAEDRVRNSAMRVIDSVPELKGYPIDLAVGMRGKRLIVTGLTPSQASKSQLVRLLSGELANTNIMDQLNVVAGTDFKPKDYTPEIERVNKNLANIELSAEMREHRTRVDGALSNLRLAARDYSKAADASADKTFAAKLRNASTQLEALIADAKLETLNEKTGGADNRSMAIYGSLADRIALTSNSLFDSGSTDNGPLKQQSISNDAFERLVETSNRSAVLASAALMSATIKPQPAPQIPLPAEPSTREKLQAFATTKAIFFSSDTEYRDGVKTARDLDELAALLKADNGLIRIVGYTDVGGGQVRNGPLAQQRADRVRVDLLARGVPPNGVVAIGRADARDISATQGAYSPNRRVEFEVGFDGEAQP